MVHISILPYCHEICVGCFFQTLAFSLTLLLYIRDLWLFLCFWNLCFFNSGFFSDTSFVPPCIRKQQFAVRHLILLPSTFYHLILFNIIKSMKNMFKNIKNHERCKKYTKMCPNYQPHYHPSLFKSVLTQIHCTFST